MIATFLIAGAVLFFGETVPPPPSSGESAEVNEPARFLNVGETFTTDDYPRESLRRNETGTTGSILAVDEHGHVTDCRIESSSGSTELDTQACRLYRERARFEPARDKQGRKIASSVHQRTRWQIPEPTLPPLADMHARLAITFDKDGKIRTCRYELLSVAITISQDCLYDPAAKQLLVARHWDVARLRGKTLIQESYLIVDDKPLPRLGEGPTETLSERASIELTIGIDGAPTDCWVIERSDDDRSLPDPCVKGRNMLFGKLPADDARKLPIKVRMVMGNYTRP